MIEANLWGFPRNLIENEKEHTLHASTNYNQFAQNIRIVKFELQIENVL